MLLDQGSVSLENSLHKITLNRVSRINAFPFCLLQMYFTECIVISLLRHFSLYIRLFLTEIPFFVEKQGLFHCLLIPLMTYSNHDQFTDNVLVSCVFVSFCHLCQIVKCMPQITWIPQSTSFIMLLEWKCSGIFPLGSFSLACTFWGLPELDILLLYLQFPSHHTCQLGKEEETWAKQTLHQHVRKSV